MVQVPARLPPDLAIGMRVATNKKYAAVYPKSPPKRTGTLVRTTWRDRNILVVLFDDVEYPGPIHRNFLEIIAGREKPMEDQP